MQREFVYHTDPDHGWAKVPLSVITALGISEAHFSRFSYREGGHLFLEEDGDLRFFVETYERKTGARPLLETHHCRGGSPIRFYPRVREGAAYRQRSGSC